MSPPQKEHDVNPLRNAPKWLQVVAAGTAFGIITILFVVEYLDKLMTRRQDLIKHEMMIEKIIGANDENRKIDRSEWRAQAERDDARTREWFKAIIDRDAMNHKTTEVIREMRNVVERIEASHMKVMQVLTK